MEEIEKVKSDVNTLMKDTQSWDVTRSILDDDSGVDSLTLKNTYEIFSAVVRGVESSLNDNNIAQELPLGSFLEDFSTGNSCNLYEEIPTSLKDCA